MLLAGSQPFQSDCQQIVLLHNSRYPLVVHGHSLLPQLCGDSSIAVPPSMLKDNILDRGSYDHFFFDSRPSSQVAIESSTANVG